MAFSGSVLLARASGRRECDEAKATVPDTFHDRGQRGGGGAAVAASIVEDEDRAGRTAASTRRASGHLLTNLSAFIATAIAGAVILLTGFTRADGIAALLVAAIRLRAAYGFLRDSGHVLLGDGAGRRRRPPQVGLVNSRQVAVALAA